MVKCTSVPTALASRLALKGGYIGFRVWAIICRGYIRIMEKNMETTIVSRGYLCIYIYTYYIFLGFSI